MAKRGLGSGIDELFGAGAHSAEDSDLRLLPISKVEPSARQPRECFDEERLQELSDSISQHGVIQPITVRRLGGGFYQIIAGERRWRAARMAGLSEIPAQVVDADDRDAMVLAMVENLQREDLNPVEQAKGLRALIDDFGLTQEDAAERVGFSRPAVSNSLRLLALPESVLAKLEEGALTSGHARALLSLEQEDAICDAAEFVIRESLNVRQTEAYVRRLLSARPGPAKRAAPSIYVQALEERLSAQFSRKVKIIDGPKKGRLEIEYYGNEDLDRLLTALGASAGE